MTLSLPRLSPLLFVAFVGLLVLPVQAFVPLSQFPEELKKENSNALLKKHKDQLQISASSSYGGGWPLTNLLDGNLQSSWFSATGDSVAQGKAPWVEIELPADEAVRRVNVIGNRDPSWPTGYFVLEGRMELLDKDRKKLWTADIKGSGKSYDFEFRPKTAVKDVRFIRFVPTKDQGDQNGSQDIALSELLVE